MKDREFLGLPEDWETLLDMRLLLAGADATRRKVYICSPCRADSANGVFGNMRAARFYMYYAYTHMRLNPCAPHAYLPALLCDRALRERALALKFGRELLTVTSKMLVCGHILTDGMRGELEKAKELGIPITVFSPGLYSEIVSAVGDKLVRYDDRHVSLVLNAGELFEF